MRRKYSYLNNSQFLLDFFKQPISEHFVKITVLNAKEKPLKEVQGIITGGNVSISGQSSLRRTANISAFIEDNVASYMEIGGLFSLNKKINIEIGITNTTDQYSEYPVLWFPLGVYVIINLNSSHGTNGTSISLQLKDKMCLLNGECGGVISAATIFHEYEILDPETGAFIIERPTLVQIIREVVNHFGGEQLGKIIINDLDTRVKQVMKWTGSIPLYRYSDSSVLTTDPFRQNEGDKIPYEAGDDVGYIYTDFTYPHNSELIGEAGSTVCDILDKIKNTLGNYEYFYDLDGNFVFQEIKNYLNTSKSTVDLKNMNQSDYLIDRKNGKAVYVFDDNYISTSYSNNPQYSQIKNDFVVWGVRKTATGKKSPIRYHLAIDEKPEIGNEYLCYFHIDEEDNIKKAKVATVYPNKDSFPIIGELGRLYAHKSEDGKNYVVYHWSAKENDYIDITPKDSEGNLMEASKITTTDWRSELYLSGAMTSRYGNDSNHYYTELVNEWPKLYDVEGGKWLAETTEHPSEIDYFLDFIDSDAAISELSISNIGRRTKVINDDSINCIFETEIPNFILIRADGDLSINPGENNTEVEEAVYRGETYTLVAPEIFDALALGGSQNSAYNMVRDLLYQYTSYNETITVQMLPMYFLTNPNVRITVNDLKSGIYGDYMLDTISMPLTAGGTMSLTCHKALERI